MPAPSIPGELENDARNPCIGCGPGNPHGLRLRFAVEGATVTGVLHAKHWMEGWPERLHSGVLYTALVETANWTAYGLTGRVGVPVRTGPFAPSRWIPTGTDVTLRGTLVRDEGGKATVKAEALLPDGTVVAAIERDLETMDRAAFVAKMGYRRIPPVLEDAFPASSEST